MCEDFNRPVPFRVGIRFLFCLKTSDYETTGLNRTNK